MNCEKCGSTDLAEYWLKGAQFFVCRKCSNVHQMNETEEHLAWLQELKEKTEQERREKLERQKPPVITCPYCQSTDTSKIGVIGRGVSFGLFGFASAKVGKQWHCNKCKSDF